MYFNGLPVEKKDGLFEDLVAVGTRLSVTAEAVSTDGRIIGKGEEIITVKSGSNNVPVKIYTYDNFVVTIDGKATGYTNFTDAWDAANKKTATIKMNADATNVAVTLASPGNVTLDLNGHTITGTGNDYVFSINKTFTLTGNGTVKQPANANAGVIKVGDGSGSQAVFNMYSGTISGNTAASGNNVYVTQYAEYTINGVRQDTVQDVSVD